MSKRKIILTFKLWSKINSAYVYSECQARIQGGGHLGHVPPPLEPNTQRKNLRRLKDLRGPIQRKSPKSPTYIFFYKDSRKSTLQFGIRKKRYMWTKSMFTSRRCVCFFLSRRTSRWPESLLKSLILAKFLSRERALSFPFIAFLYSILSTLQFGIKKNHICLRKVCLHSPKNGQTVVTAAQRHSALSYSIKAIRLILGSAVKFVIWGL